MNIKSIIENSPTAHTIELKKSEVLYHQGDKPQKIYFIIEGLVGLFHIQESGKESFLRVFSKDSLLGHRSFLANEQYHGTSVALEKTKILAVNKEDCESLCLNSPTLLLEVAKKMAKDLGDAELRLSGLSDKNAFTRITEALIFLKLHHPDHTWTRKEIAEYSGSTFETVARVMSQLTENGLIEKDKRDFNILDLSKLIELTHEV